MIPSVNRQQPAIFTLAMPIVVNGVNGVNKIYSIVQNFYADDGRFFNIIAPCFKR